MSLVSIIIPCYNYGWLLAETLESVRAQTYQEWECIIVNDGSKDNTQQVAEHYQQQDNRFHYVYQKNGGMSSARNHGLRVAKGQYIQFLDADDLLLPRKLEFQVSFLEQHPIVDIVYGDVRYFRHGEPDKFSYSFDMLNIPWIQPLRGNGLPILQKLLEINLLVMNAPLLRSSVIKAAGNFAEQMRAMEDWDFWIRCAAANQYFQYDDNPDAWTLVRVHPTSTSQNHQRMLAYVERVREQLHPLLVKFGNSYLVTRNQELLEYVRIENARYNLHHGDVIEGIRGYWRLAQHSGQYLYHFKNAAYWLRKRFQTS